MSLYLRASMVRMVSDLDPSKSWPSFWLEVAEPTRLAQTGNLWDRCAPEFRFMCDAIHTSTEAPEGEVPNAIKAVRLIEMNEASATTTVGNGWIAHVRPDRVWFEGLHGQGVGGEVSFAQYKLAVETYVRFLADPEHKTIEVPFPEA